MDMEFSPHIGKSKSGTTCRSVKKQTVGGTRLDKNLGDTDARIDIRSRMPE
jgi:hypothetical protein